MSDPVNSFTQQQQVNDSVEASFEMQHHNNEVIKLALDTIARTVDALEKRIVVLEK